AAYRRRVAAHYSRNLRRRRRHPRATGGSQACAMSRILFALLPGGCAAAQAAGLCHPMLLVPAPGADAAAYRGTVLVVAPLGAGTVDTIIRAEAASARFVAGCVGWQAGELREEIERGAWYVLAPDAGLLSKPADGLWEELVRRSQAAANAI